MLCRNRAEKKQVDAETDGSFPCACKTPEDIINRTLSPSEVKKGAENLSIFNHDRPDRLDEEDPPHVSI